MTRNYIFTDDQSGTRERAGPLYLVEQSKKADLLA